MVNVPVNVAVVELYVVDYQTVRFVVNEFRSLVEKSGIVFVTFYDEIITFAVHKSCIRSDRYSSDQV